MAMPALAMTFLGWPNPVGCLIGLTPSSPQPPAGPRVSKHGQYQVYSYELLRYGTTVSQISEQRKVPHRSKGQERERLNDKHKITPSPSISSAPSSPVINPANLAPRHHHSCHYDAERFAKVPAHRVRWRCSRPVSQPVPVLPTFTASNGHGNPAPVFCRMPPAPY